MPVRPLMRLVLPLLGLALLAGLIALPWSDLAGAIRASQREVQAALAGAVRAIGRGDPAGWTALLSLCLGYGFLHAAGPGHGKVLFAGYGLARPVALTRLALVTLAASLAQAGVAILLVASVLGLLGLARKDAEGVAADLLSPLGAALIAALGLWLFWRGLRKLAAFRPAAPAPRLGLAARHLASQKGAPLPSPIPVCADCGTAHGPDLHAVLGARGLYEHLALIMGVAIRPCTGALFLLAITFQLGIPLAGIAGALAMGIGTAAFTLIVVVIAVTARRRGIGQLAPRWAAPAMAITETAAGALVLLAALALFSLPG